MIKITFDFGDRRYRREFYLDLTGKLAKDLNNGIPINLKFMHPKTGNEVFMFTEWEEEFNRLIDNEECTPQETLLITNGKDFEPYPESEYGLDPFKVKAFIKELLSNGEKPPCNHSIKT